MDALALRCLACAALLLLAGCFSGEPELLGGGNGGGSGGGGGGGSVAPVTVGRISPPSRVTGTVSVRFTLVDPAGAAADVVVEFSRDAGATWLPAHVTGAQTGLATSAAGIEHQVAWDSLADAGFRLKVGVTLRITPRQDGVDGVPTSVVMPVADNLATVIDRIETQMTHYGPMSAADVKMAETFDLVVVHPSAGGITADVVHEIQDGFDPDDASDDVVVLTYISIGEDARTHGMSDAEMLADPRFVGDGSGPRIDPRGPDADGDPLTGLDPLGIPSNGGTGFASWYLDDNSVDQDPNNVGDGSPDRNSIFGGCFANAGDPQWFEVLDQMQFDGVDGMPGMRELLTDSYGRGYDSDGLFLDTMDTCAPNRFTNAQSINQSEFEWTAAGFAEFTRRLRERYPDKLILQNRALFFYDPRQPQYEVNPRQWVDFVFFESYRLNSNTSETFNPSYYADNRFNVAPKLVAESQRPDGFRVLSLGYAEGPAATMDERTLVGGSTVGLASLQEDVVQTSDTLGFLHYLTNAEIVLVNHFVEQHRNQADSDPPVWTSVFNVNNPPWPTEATAAVPRVGVQEVVPGAGSVVVRWDVAIDQSPVGYALYHSPSPFDFAGDPTLSAVTRVVLEPGVGEGYEDYQGAPLPFEAPVTGLTNGVTHHFCLRAFDAAGNEDQNQVVLTAVPQSMATITIDGDFADWDAVPVALVDPADVPASSGPDWLELKVANDATNLYVRFTSENPFNLDGSPSSPVSRSVLFLDTDDDPGTGYPASAEVGSELMLTGDTLVLQDASTFNKGVLARVQVNPTTAITECELAIPLWAVHAGNLNPSRLRFLLVNDEVGDLAPDAGSLRYTIATGWGSGGAGSGSGGTGGGTGGGGTGGGGTGGGGTGGGGGGGLAPVSVARIVPPATVAGTVPLRFTLVDAASAPADVTVDFSRDGGMRWLPAHVTGPVAGLATSPAGQEHALLWDTFADAGFRAPVGVVLRVSAFQGGVAGGRLSVVTAAPSNLAEAVARIDSQMTHYGPLDQAALQLAETFDLVVLHPFAGAITPEEVREIQDGVDPVDATDDVFVLSYISIGEDLRTVGLSDAQMLLDPRFVGTGTGPRIDPRGPAGAGGPLSGLDPLGLPSNGGTGFASWYLDDNSVTNSPTGTGDGSPDRNVIFGGCFVNAGDPQWFEVLDQMLFDGVDGMPGMRELLTGGYGRGYGSDGLFLDTMDTCAPNSFTNESSPNQSEFEWTAAGFADFTRRLRERYPSKLILQNRALFFYDPRHPHYQVNPRPWVDLVLFESFRLNSNTTEEYDPYFYADNRFNVAPKLLAEAQRPDGFRVLSLGYAEGPPGTMSLLTLVGQSTVGLASLLEDVVQTEDTLGFLHYLTDAGLTFANDFVRAQRATADATPPSWTSVYNANNPPFPTPSSAPTPRVGVQEAIPGQGSVTLRWDVAVDQGEVGYAVYYSDTPFDFAGDPTLSGANRVVPVPTVASGYQSYSSAALPFEGSVGGLQDGTTYYFCVRAFDAAGNEEQNQNVLTATPQGVTAITIDGAFADWAPVPLAHLDPADVPDSAGPDWLEVTVANDLDDLFLRFTSDNAFNLDGSPTYGYSRCLVFIDADDDPATGYPISGAVGSELMIAGDTLFAQSATSFNAGFLRTLDVNPTTNVTECELAVPLLWIRAAAPGASRLRIQLINDEVSDHAPDGGPLYYTLATR